MTSETLQKAIGQNHHNLKQIIDALETGYEMDDDPEAKAERVAFFGGEKAVDVELSDEERLAWMFEQNVEATAAIAEAVGVPEHAVEGDVTAAHEKYAGLFVPASEAQRAASKDSPKAEEVRIGHWASKED